MMCICINRISMIITTTIVEIISAKRSTWFNNRYAKISNKISLQMLIMSHHSISSFLTIVLLNYKILINCDVLRYYSFFLPKEYVYAKRMCYLTQQQIHYNKHYYVTFCHYHTFFPVFFNSIFMLFMSQIQMACKVFHYSSNLNITKMSVLLLN